MIDKAFSSESWEERSEHTWQLIIRDIKASLYIYICMYIYIYIYIIYHIIYHIVFPMYIYIYIFTYIYIYIYIYYNTSKYTYKLYKCWHKLIKAIAQIFLWYVFIVLSVKNIYYIQCIYHTYILFIYTYKYTYIYM